MGTLDAFPEQDGRALTRDEFIALFRLDNWAVPETEIPDILLEEPPETRVIFENLYRAQGEADALRGSLPAETHEAYIQGYCRVRGWTYLGCEGA